YFDTLHVDGGGVAGVSADALVRAALDEGINIRRVDHETVGIALDETATKADLDALVRAFAKVAGREPVPLVEPAGPAYPAELARRSAYLTHPIFNSHHSETEMMRYIRSLERRDIGLGESMIPLGSCTMKLNAAAEMMPVSWAAFARLHPFAPAAQAAGYAPVFGERAAALRPIPRFDA